MIINIEYSNGDKFVAELSQECINELFACVFDDIGTTAYKKEKPND